MQFNRTTYTGFCDQVARFEEQFEGVKKASVEKQQEQIPQINRDLEQLRATLGRLQNELEVAMASASDEQISPMLLVLTELNNAEGTLNNLDRRTKALSTEILNKLSVRPNQASSHASGSGSGNQESIHTKSVAFSNDVEKLIQKCARADSTDQISQIGSELRELQKKLRALRDELNGMTNRSNYTQIQSDQLLETRTLLNSADDKMINISRVLEDKTVEILSRLSIPEARQSHNFDQYTHFYEEVKKFEKECKKSQSLDQIDQISLIESKLTKFRRDLAKFREDLSKVMEKTQDEETMEVYIGLTVADDTLTMISNNMFRQWLDMINEHEPESSSSSSSASSTSPEQMARSAVKNLADQIFVFNQKIEGFNKSFLEWNANPSKDVKQKEKYTKLYSEYNTEFKRIESECGKLSTIAKKMPQYNLLTYMLNGSKTTLSMIDHELKK